MTRLQYCVAVNDGSPLFPAVAVLALREQMRWSATDARHGHVGALGGIRTPNLLIRSQMLYPLSYERWWLDVVRTTSAKRESTGFARCDAQVTPAGHKPDGTQDRSHASVP